MFAHHLPAGDLGGGLDVPFVKGFENDDAGVRRVQVEVIDWDLARAAFIVTSSTDLLIDAGWPRW